MCSHLTEHTCGDMLQSRNRGRSHVLALDALVLWRNAIITASSPQPCALIQSRWGEKPSVSIISHLGRWIWSHKVQLYNGPFKEIRKHFRSEPGRVCETVRGISVEVAMVELIISRQLYIAARPPGEVGVGGSRCLGGVSSFVPDRIRWSTICMCRPPRLQVRRLSSRAVRLSLGRGAPRSKTCPFVLVWGPIGPKIARR